MRPASLFPHQTPDELELAYRQFERAVERSRWQILWLKSKGLTIPARVSKQGKMVTATKAHEVGS